MSVSIYDNYKEILESREKDYKIITIFLNYMVECAEKKSKDCIKSVKKKYYDIFKDDTSPMTFAYDGYFDIDVDEDKYTLKFHYTNKLLKILKEKDPKLLEKLIKHNLIKKHKKTG